MTAVERDFVLSLAAGRCTGLWIEGLTAFRTFKRFLQLIRENLDFGLTSRTDNLYFIHFFVALKSWTMLICHGAPPAYVYLPTMNAATAGIILNFLHLKRRKELDAFNLFLDPTPCAFPFPEKKWHTTGDIYSTSPDLCRQYRLHRQNTGASGRYRKSPPPDDSGTCPSWPES